MAQKRSYNPAHSRSQILLSAQELFLERGYHATSMSAIARRAGVTQSIIHHYFGSKAALWAEVKNLAYGDYLAYQQTLIDTGNGDIAGFLENSLRSRFTFLQANPHVVRLLAWLQIMEDPYGMETGQETGRRILDLIREAQAAGAIRADIEAENVLAIALALTTHWFQSRHIICHYAGLDAEPAEALDARYLEAIIRVLTEGLRMASPD